MTTKVGLYRDQRNKRRPWVVRWFGEYDPSTDAQRHYSKSFARKRQAEVFRAARQAQLDRGGIRDVPRDILVEEFMRRFTEHRLQHRRPATRATYRLSLEQLCEFVGHGAGIRSVTSEVADAFIASRTRVARGGTGYSPWSRNQHLRNVKAAFNAAVEWGYLSHNPFKNVRPQRCRPRQWHHLTPHDFARLLGAGDDRRWRAFYLLAYTTGARFGELFNLTWVDIDFERGVGTVHDRAGTKLTPPFRVKDYEARSLRLPGQTVEALLAWQGEAPDGVPYILLTEARWRIVQAKWTLCHGGKPWKRNHQTDELVRGEWENRHMVNNVRRDIRVHLDRAGIKTEVPMTIHTFRKSFGQNHADAGTPMHVLQKLMGHASITTTRDFYLQTADANEREAAARYEAILKTASDETCVGLLNAG